MRVMCRHRYPARNPVVERCSVGLAWLQLRTTSSQQLGGRVREYHHSTAVRCSTERRHSQVVSPQRFAFGVILSERSWRAARGQHQRVFHTAVSHMYALPLVTMVW